MANHEYQLIMSLDLRVFQTNPKNGRHEEEINRHVKEAQKPLEVDTQTTSL